MNTSTHRLMANKIMDNLEQYTLGIVKRESFIWGNIKPDTVSKYKLIKHYFIESFDMVIAKIEYLSTFTLEDLGSEKASKRFSAELGVVCHFLCDYFTLPHYERWEFKHSMKKHINYEKKLGHYAKKFKVYNVVDERLNIHDIPKFIMDKQMEYTASHSYEEDLSFAFYVCNVVVALIIQSIIENSDVRIENLVMI